MVANAKLAKEVGEKKEWKKILEEALEEMMTKLEEVAKETKKKEQYGESSAKGKEKIIEEDIVLTVDPQLIEESFLKSIKALGHKALERIPLFGGKMDLELVMECI